MAATNFSQPGAELKIQDGGAHKKMAMLENSPSASTEDHDLHFEMFRRARPDFFRENT